MRDYNGFYDEVLLSVCVFSLLSLICNCFFFAFVSCKSHYEVHTALALDGLNACILYALNKLLPSTVNSSIHFQYHAQSVLYNREIDRERKYFMRVFAYLILSFFITGIYRCVCVLVRNLGGVYYYS